MTYREPGNLTVESCGKSLTFPNLLVTYAFFTWLTTGATMLMTRGYKFVTTLFTGVKLYWTAINISKDYMPIRLHIGTFHTAEQVSLKSWSDAISISSLTPAPFCIFYPHLDTCPPVPDTFPRQIPLTFAE